MNAGYRITVLELGYDPLFPADVAFDGALQPGAHFYSPFCMTLLQREGRNILVDTGFDLQDPVKQQMARDSNIVNGCSPRQVLATVGLTPADISAVILTHAHWDHIGALDCYPNAHFFLQQEELERWEELVVRPGYESAWQGVTDPADLPRLRALQQAGRLDLLQGEVDELFPGICIRVSPMAHSAALQIVLAQGCDGLCYVLASDVYFRPENVFGPRFLPARKCALGGILAAMDTYNRILTWTDHDPQRAVTCHDGTLFQRFPSRKSELGLHIISVCQ